jgi:Kef-type K+ transport system membrane component KefB
MILEELFFQIGFIVAVAGVLSLAASFLRQPLIMAYIIAGVVVGPSVLAVTHNTEVFQVMAELGVAFLLFTVGLGLNWRDVKDVGGISLATGVGQVLFTSVAGFAVGLLIGLDSLTSLYLAVAFAFEAPHGQRGSKRALWPHLHRVLACPRFSCHVAFTCCGRIFKRSHA